ncbi:MAG: DNA mismatch repair endonuclease MutL [Desulfobacterales bacterium]|nr:DNA mismatch repair endonuclease MutL [Desulfobacterales bacterium]
MSIRILPEILSNKIAAGEVVERPASVVKELVENAIDAGSRRIRIEVERGGKSLIRVSDDGCGMGKDDALLSIERYATSKIADEKDLFSIRTLGFRGEALPSIASVSRFSLVTRNPGQEAGTEILIEGGTIRRVTEAGAPPGTMVSVRQLFFNTPARRKFLKTVNTEMGHIAEVVSATALARSRIGFKLFHDGKPVKDWPSVTDGADRVADVLGKDLRNSLYPVSAKSEPAAVSGWIGSPLNSRSTSRGIYLFVNGRWVKDRILQHALFAGYGGRLMKGRYPATVLFIDVPFDRVDVNVHPTKHEVRFSDAGKVHDAVAEAVKSALDESDRPVWEPKNTVQGSRFKIQDSKGDVQETVNQYRIFSARHPGRSEAESRDPGKNWISPDQGPGQACQGRNEEPATTTSQDREPWVPEMAAPPSGKGAEVKPWQEGLWQKGRFSDLRVVGQFSNSYIVCEADRLLVLVDQHAAHERILYENIRNGSRDRAPASQRLLLPETFELGLREAEIIANLADRLGAMGFEIEPFGGQSFVVRAVPAMLMDRQIGPIIEEIADKAAQIGAASDPDAAVDDARKIVACHGAVRAHQSLSQKEMQTLLADLDRCEDPAHCPHGRPTWIEWPETQIEKRFKR